MTLMKLTSYSLLAAAVLMTLAGNVQAATITGSDETPATTITQMPGSPSEYYIVGNAPVLPNVSSISDDGNYQYYYYSQIQTPGSPSAPSDYTGIIFNHGYPPAETDLLTFTLGSSPVTTFDHWNFNLYVLYDNTTGDSNSVDTSITLSTGNTTIGPGNTIIGTTVLVSDPATKLTNAGRIVTFHLQGFQAGETFTIGALGGYTGNITPYIGGISFQSLEVPEPSTYAMMLAGLAFLGFCVRRKGTQVK
jgi:hypothetical protein